MDLVRRLFRMGKEATAERPAEQWASAVDEAGQTYYYNTMESDEAKVQDVVKRYHSIICEETKKEDPCCYFTGGKVVVKDKEATAKLFGYKSWGAVVTFFSEFQFKLVGGGVRGCPWSVYQHEHFRADGADLHLVQRNDEGSRCSKTGMLRSKCDCGGKDKNRVQCGGALCPKSKTLRAYCKLGCESRDGKPSSTRRRATSKHLMVCTPRRAQRPRSTRTRRRHWSSAATPPLLYLLHVLLPLPYQHVHSYPLLPSFLPSFLPSLVISTL